MWLIFNSLFALFQKHISSEKQLVELISYAIIAFGIFVFLWLMSGAKAAYGRYNSESIFTKIMIPARLAWLLQEVPSLIIPLCYVITAFESLSAPNFVIISLFIIHYAQRSLVYSFLIKGGKPTPVHLFLGGLLFCTVNGYIQGVWQTRYVQYDSFWLTKPITCIGISVFVLGALVNIQSDAILRNLRRPGEKGYKIPKGGLFEYCSSANYFGELIEWIGYALAAQTLPSLTFAVFTFCNLAPRALYHHKWYLQKFEDYPKNRKAIIPFLL